MAMKNKLLEAQLGIDPLTVIGYLMIMIHRAGGRVELENISASKGKVFSMKVDEDFKNDRTVITCAEVRPMPVSNQN